MTAVAAVVMLAGTALPSAAGGASSATGAAGGWSIVPSRDPSASMQQLAGVSCTNATFCMAAGVYYDGEGPARTLIESWNGHRWTVVPSADGSAYDFLAGVSCSSPTFCVAVGAYQDGSDDKSLAETWDGSGWTLASAPNLGTNDILRGVSCAGPTSCVAVGEYEAGESDARKTLIETFDGTSWTIAHSPNRATDFGDTLAAVSCTSSTSCVAVGGAFEDPGSASAVIETFDGASWKLTKSADPPHFANQLLGVSCTSSVSCDAAGDSYVDGGAYQTLNESWDGVHWSVASPPVASAQFSSVSCTSATNCAAVGEQAAGGLTTLVATSDGSGWSITPSENRVGVKNYLLGVSCTERPFCDTVGNTATDAGISASLVLTSAEGRLPGAPTDVAATPGSESASVSWTPPARAGAPITTYVVTVEPGGQQVKVPAPTTSTTVTGLTNGQSYTFTVVADNRFGSSDPSTASNSVVPVAGPPVEIPSSRFIRPATTGASAVPVRETWAVDTDSNGVCAYQLQQSTSGGAYADVVLGSPTDTSVDLALEPGTNYGFRLAVTDCVGGTSGWGVEKVFSITAWQESSPNLRFTGGWATTAVEAAYGGALSSSTDTSATLSASFDAFGVALVAERGPNYGLATIYIDDVVFATINLHSTTTRDRAVVYKSDWPSQGRHTIRMFVDTKSPTVGIDVDALLILHR